jgi:hypothetical protein
VSAPGEIRFTNHANGKVTIDGVTHADLRLWAAAISEGSFTGGDSGGQVSQALLRLAKAMRTPCSFTGRIGSITIVGGSSNADELYEEVPR